MPTGTRNSISANSATNPIPATASVLMPRLLRRLQPRVMYLVGMEDQAVSADRDQQHRRNIARPCDREERPGRHVHVEGRDMILIGAAHLVEQRPGLHRHDEQKHERCEHVDQALVFWPDVTPHQIDGDVSAAIGGGGNAPENQDTEHHAPDVEGIGNRIAEQIAQEHRGKNVDRHDADEAGRDPFDRVDKTIHGTARHFSYGVRKWKAERAGTCGQIKMKEQVYGAKALYLVSEARNSESAASGSIPVLRTASFQVLTNGLAAFFQSARPSSGNA